MDSRRAIAMLPLAIDTRDMRSRAKRSEALQRKIEIAGVSVFLILAISYWRGDTASKALWVMAYLMAAMLSVVSSRNLMTLCLTGLAATGYGLAAFAVTGLMQTELSLTLFTRDSLGLLAVSFWFGMIFIRDLRSAREHDRLNVSPYEFISLRKMGR